MRKPCAARIDNDHVDPKTALVILATAELGFTSPVDHLRRPVVHKRIGRRVVIAV